jgi:hypothetical protein
MIVTKSRGRAREASASPRLRAGAERRSPQDPLPSD